VKKIRLRTPLVEIEKLENIWGIFHINIGIIEKFKPKMMAKITGQQNRDHRCVANLPSGESSVANFPCGKSSGNL